MELKNKKISLSLLLTSIVTIIFFSILQEKKKVYYLDEYGRSFFKRQRIVEFLEITISFNNSLFFLFIAVIVFTISLIYINDEIIIKTFKTLIKKTCAFKFPSLWNSLIKKIIISMIVTITILLIIGKCNRSKNLNSDENNEEIMDTIAVIDSTAVSSSAKNNESINSTNTKNNIDSFISAEAIHAATEKTAIGKAMKGSTLQSQELLNQLKEADAKRDISKALKGSPLEFEGDIATQGLSTDQINRTGGEGPQSVDAAFLESARNNTSKNKKK